METYHGKAGKVNFSGADLVGGTVTITSWTLTESGDIAEDTSMGDSWQSFKAGFIDLSATAEANAETAFDAPALIGTDAALQLWIDGTHHFDASDAICTEITETCDKDDVGKLSFSFAGNDSTGISYT